MECFMLVVSENGLYPTIKANIENNMTYGTEIYPRTKNKTLCLQKNYHVIKQTTYTVLVKREVTFEQIGGEVNTNNKG